MLLWEEYRAEHNDGYGYSRFCDLYGDWRKGVTATMRHLDRALQSSVQLGELPSIPHHWS
jgi:transposase